MYPTPVLGITAGISALRKGRDNYYNYVINDRVTDRSDSSNAPAFIAHASEHVVIATNFEGQLRNLDDNS